MDDARVGAAFRAIRLGRGMAATRPVASNVDAVAGADVVLLAIKPQMLARVGPELASVLRPGQLVLSILAGATTAALTGALRHRQVIRSMPNTPARLGKGMTVWYAT